MQAVRWHGPNDARLEEVELEPVAIERLAEDPGGDVEVLIDVAR